jgi:hypothetical protein
VRSKYLHGITSAKVAGQIMDNALRVAQLMATCVETAFNEQPIKCIRKQCGQQPYKCEFW